MGRLVLAINAMLGQIERAFAERTASEERLRRSSPTRRTELRTPLASNRGYAELYRIGAARKPADLQKAMTPASRRGRERCVLSLARMGQSEHTPWVAVAGIARSQWSLNQRVRDAADAGRAAVPDRGAFGDAAPDAETVDRAGLDELEELITEAWLCRAPKRLGEAFPIGGPVQ